MKTEKEILDKIGELIKAHEVAQFEGTNSIRKTESVMDQIKLLEWIIEEN